MCIETDQWPEEDDELLPLLSALPPAALRNATRLALQCCPYNNSLLATPLSALTTLISLRLATYIDPASAGWLPSSLRRLELSDGCGAAWCEAVGPCCSSSLEAVEFTWPTFDHYPMAPLSMVRRGVS